MSNSMINNQQQFDKIVDLFVSKFASKHEKPLWYYHNKFYGEVIPIIIMKVQTGFPLWLITGNNLDFFFQSCFFLLFPWKKTSQLTLLMKKITPVGSLNAASLD